MNYKKYTRSPAEMPKKQLETGLKGEGTKKLTSSDLYLPPSTCGHARTADKATRLNTGNKTDR
jgi:hypothetical protein